MKMSEIINMRNNGATYQEIADAVGLSKQRVRTIIINHSPELKGTRGSALRRANDLINRQRSEIERYKGVIKLLENDMLTAKAEAVKEFEKLVTRRLNCNTPRGAYLLNIMNEVKKEMTESVNYESSKTEGNG